jgi:hypothetical protein
MYQSSAGFRQLPFGWSEPTAHVGDFDGDGKADPALYHAESGNWYVYLSSISQVWTLPFGTSDTYGVPADYDGDGTTDIAILTIDRVLYVHGSSVGTWSQVLPRVGDWILTGDFNRDGREEIAQYAPAQGLWIITYAEGNHEARNFGFEGTLPTHRAVYIPVLPPYLPIKTRGEGFLWKPLSEKDHKLLVLLPSYMKTEIVERVVVAADPAGVNEIEPGQGRFTGKFGSRPKWRFPKPGSYYGGPCYVVVVFNDGTRQPYAIADGAVRQE